MKSSQKTTFILLFILFLLIGGWFGITLLDKNNEVEKLQQELFTLQSKENELQTKLEKSESQNEKYSKEMNKIDESIKALEKRIGELEKENKSLSDENKKLEGQNKQLERDLQAKLESKKQTVVASNNTTSASSNNSNVKPNKETSKGTTNTYNGPKTAYLTFDDGPSANTERILNTLKQEGIKATFFVNGNGSDFAKKMYKRIVNEGHTIANHTYSHDYAKIYKNTDNFMADVEKLNQLLQSTVGKSPKIIRYPGGSNNTVSHKYGYKGLTKDIAKELSLKGYVFFDWNVDSTDASVSLQSKRKIIDNVLTGSKNKKNAIILFHDSKPKTTTAEALPEVIKGLKAQGFTFESLTTNSYAPQFINKKY